MKKRDIFAGGVGALAIGSVIVNNPSTIGSLAAGTVWVVWAVWDTVASTLNYVAPAAVAWAAAPLTSAASAAYLANGAMNIIGVENRIARGLALAGSAVAWYGAGSVAQPFLIWGAAVKWVWDIGKMVWNSDAMKKLGSSTRTNS